MGESGADSRIGFEALTPRERECLRLVARHQQSKEIARLLNISKSTVDKHIDRARKRIGAADRRTAALAFVAHEEALNPGMDTGYPPDPDTISKPTASRSVEPQFNAEPGDPSDPVLKRPADLQSGVPGQLGLAGNGPQPAGQPGPGGQHPDHHLGPAPVAAVAAAGEAAGADPQRHRLADLRRTLLSRGGLHDLTPLRLLLLVAVMAIVGGLLLGGVLMAAHEVVLLIQRIVDGVVPPRG